MTTITDAVNSLKEGLKNKGVEKHVQDAFNHLAPYLVLLDSSFPSVQMIQKLCTVLRQPLLPLYCACLQPALELSCAVLSTVLGRLCDTHDVEGKLSAAWNATAEVILSGFLDFLDQNDGDVQSDIAVWKVLNRIVCEFFFHDPGRGHSVFSISLCLSAYNTLTETAARQVTVWNALHDKTVLGGERLGAVISRTRDYLVLEALLMLFARLLPPIPQGKSERTKFVKEVFGFPKLFKCHAELLEIMQKTNERHWDDVAAQIIDSLARSDITYPQPFSIDEIVVCGRVFPQPLATDRLIMDRQAFLVNIIFENDDQCESLQVPYSHIRTITLDNSNQDVPKGRVLITVYLTSPPLVSNVEMDSPGECHLHAKFFLQHDAMSRFMEALRRRGVGKLSFLNPLTRVKRTHKSVSIGSGFEFMNDSSPIPPTASFEGKVQHVNQVYKTDTEDLAMSEVTPVSCGDMCPSPASVPEPAFKDGKLVPEILQSTVCEDDPLSLHSTALTSCASETSNPTQEFPISLPGDSTLFGDADAEELSEISEFEPDGPTINKRAATAASAHCDQGPKQTRSEIDCTPVKGSASITSVVETGKSFDCSLKNGDRTEGVAQSREPLLASDSPIFGSSSSTQINVSPKPRSLTPVCTEIVDGLSAASQNSVSKDMPRKIGVDAAALSRTELVITSVEQPQKELNLAEGELRQRIEHVSASSGANQQIRSRTKITGDTSIPPKIAGNRRKREIVNFSSTALIEVDDEPIPRKKRRDDKLRIKDSKDKSDETSPESISIPKVKRRTKTAKGSGRGPGATVFHVDGSPGLTQSCQGTRKSSRIKGRQAAITGGGRVNGMYGKKEKKANDTSVDTTCQGITSTPIVITDPTHPKADSHIPLTELRSTENITPEMTIPRQTLKASSILPRQPSFTPVKEPQSDLVVAQQAASARDTTQSLHKQLYAQKEQTIDDQHITLAPCSVYSDIFQAQEVVEHPLCANDGENSVKLSRPIVQSTPPAKTVTIDLTTEDTPAEVKNKLQKTSVNLLQPEANTQTKFTTPDQSGHIVLEESPFATPPRPKRLSVTFASPIEYVLDKKVKLKTRASPSRNHQSFLVSESNTLSPLKIPTRSGTMKMGSASANQIQTQKSKLLQADKYTTDEVGLQDIVGVLNEIHAAIIKGISDKSRNVKKKVQRSRDELIQQVLDELQGMVVENAKHFNDLLRLEEDYHKNGRAMTRCWEELIDTNDCIAEYVQKALKEHDKNITARTFPKSLPPRKPGFLCRRANA